MEILKLMEERHSVRKYLDKPVETEKRTAMEALARRCEAESGLSFRILWDEPECFKGLLAHYGGFRNVSNYIAILGREEGDACVRAGYHGEKLVLKAQEMGLNTCWVALTHGRCPVAPAAGERLIILIALGYGSETGKPHRSKPEETLVRSAGREPEWFRRGVRGALLAPTAVNRQRFQIEWTGTQARITAPKDRLAQLDLGIVRCHFEAASGHPVI